MALGTHLLPLVLTHQRPLRASDGQGGFATTYPTIGTLRGRIAAASASERTAAARREAVVTHVGYLLPGIDVRKDDRLLDGARTFIVDSALPPSLPHHTKLLLRELQVGG